MKRDSKLRILIGATAVTGMVLGTAATAVAADAGATPATEKRYVYVPHKYGYPFHFREVPSETAEFARMEVAPDRKNPHTGPISKSGNPFPIAD